MVSNKQIRNSVGAKMLALRKTSENYLKVLEMCKMTEQALRKNV